MMMLLQEEAAVEMMTPWLTVLREKTMRCGTSAWPMPGFPCFAHVVTGSLLLVTIPLDAFAEVDCQDLTACKTYIQSNKVKKGFSDAFSAVHVAAGSVAWVPPAQFVLPIALKDMTSIYIQTVMAVLPDQNSSVLLSDVNEKVGKMVRSSLVKFLNKNKHQAPWGDLEKPILQYLDCFPSK